MNTSVCVDTRLFHEQISNHFLIEIQVGPSSSTKSISSSSFTQSGRFDSSKSSAESLTLVDAAVSVPQLPPPVPERRKSLDEATQKFIESHRLKQSIEQSQPTTGPQSAATTVNRKSVSFDLSDNEYIPVFEHEEPPKSAPPQTENLAELFLSQFSQESEGDGYEVPIKYPTKGRSKRPSPPVKSILRSPSPNASIPLSSDRPLRTTLSQPHATQTVTAAIVHATRSSDEEIERENPFRKEFLEHRPYENIYEEIASNIKPKDTGKRYSSDSDSNEQATSRYATPKKIRPKSAYSAVDSDTYTEIMPKNSQSNENLLQASETEHTLPTRPAYKSTGSLIDRPKHKPPLPPKPVVAAASASSLTSPPSSQEHSQPTVKHADVLQNEALKIFQSEMQRGGFYEFKHDATTNKIIKVKQQAPPEIASPSEPGETNRPKTFSQESPLPPIPPSTYTKVYRRNISAERPPESPPPPPINLATLPSSDKLRKIDSGDGHIVEIHPKTHRRDSHHENSPDYNLVTETTHREILLQENELRNALQQEQVVVTENTITTSRLPIRRAPAPPASTKTTCEQQLAPPPPPPQQQQQQQIFPQTQILPVQYSQLPSPQQPGYFHAYAPTTYSFVVSDTNRVYHHPNAVPNIPTYHHPGPSGSFIVQSPPQPILTSPLVAPSPVQFHYNNNHNQPNYLNLPNWTAPTSYTIDSHPSNFGGYLQPSQSLPQPQQQGIHHQSHSFDHNSSRHFEQIISNRTRTNTIPAYAFPHSPHSSNANTIPLSLSSHIYDEAYESSVYANDNETISSSIFAGERIPAATLSGSNRDISLLSRTLPTTATLPDNGNSPTLMTFGKQTSV